MKRILQGEDLDFCITIVDNQDNELNYNLFKTYKIIAYTNKLEDGIVLDRTRIIDNKISLDADELLQLKNGILKLKYEIEIDDYSKSGEIVTRYYIDFGDDNNDNNGNCCRCNCC